MYTTNIAHVLHNQKIFETGSRLLQFFTLSLKSAVHKNKDDNETLSYFLNLIRKGSTVLDIGAHNDDYLYLMLKMAKRAGSFITFESEPDMYDYLSEKKEILKLKNVTVEQLAFSEIKVKTTSNVSLQKKSSATVIDFKTRISQEAKKAPAAHTLDNYCTTHHIQPGFLKINGQGNELSILNGATEILQRHKPKILLECEERHSGQGNVLKTFQFLTDLKYSGYFILDVMKIPLINFDSNIYQNPLSNFYCKEFIFE
ncbi:MAG: FkbM family methyltransferase [Segetibacter sp.]